jgi:transposase
MNYIQPADRHQYQLMSSLDDLVEPNHPVRIIDKIVDSIVGSNPSRFSREREQEAGRPRYHDSTKLKLYLYGYFNGISSSRKLEAETHRNIELIWLLGGLRPDHWTISNYRKEKGEDIKYVTKKFREFLRANGYIKMKIVGLDGSKIKANANRDMLTMERIEGKMEGLGKSLEEYLSKLQENDIRDEIIDEMQGYEEGEEKKKYLEKIIELQKQIEKLQSQKEILEKEDRTRISPSDLDARLMKSREGKIPGYNVQIVVDEENKMIVDSEVLCNGNDKELLPVMVASIKEELVELPKEIIADRGYNNPDLIERIEASEEDVQIYTSQEKTLRDKEEIKFNYDPEKDEYICSAGKRLVLHQKNKRLNKSRGNIYLGIECEGCQLRSQCTSSKKGRTVRRYFNQQWRDQYKKKMLSRMGKSKTSIRKTIVEHPFGTIKCLMGKIPLLLRGLTKVSTEINLYLTAYNLKRLINIDTFESLMLKIEQYKWETV